MITYLFLYLSYVNTLKSRQNCRHFVIFKGIFLKENMWISLKMSLKFVPNGPLNNIPVLFQIMAWCRTGDKVLSEPMMVRLLTHICVTRTHGSAYHCLSNNTNHILFPVPWVYQYMSRNRTDSETSHLAHNGNAAVPVGRCKCRSRPKESVRMLDKFLHDVE